MSKCDIIIPVWNQLKDTEECISSIKRNTLEPYRLIIIDNASNSQTKEYLASLEKDRHTDVKVVQNEKNEGFIKAVNKGISLSTAEYVCILNNDTLVTPGWLEELINVSNKALDIAIVNPSSNTLGQRLQKGKTLEEHAKAIRAASGRFVELGGAFAFCMLVKRKLFDEIGYFDEVYGMGYFEDTDFSLRAKERGYKTVRAFASYVYHKERISFNLLKDFKINFEKNRKLFESRWGKPKRITVVSQNIEPKFIDFLKNILKKYAKEKSWVYVISPSFETREFFENFSNLTFYHYKHFLYPLAFIKILFKKKKSDIVYSDSNIFLHFLGLFGIFHKAKIENIK